MQRSIDRNAKLLEFNSVHLKLKLTHTHTQSTQAKLQSHINT
uniref:Uncharacterized protein n=1 Tax=Rhizophora mucronata TaxID=61149 RepID=A0A2P2IWT7_RHIMU